MATSSNLIGLALGAFQAGAQTEARRYCEEALRQNPRNFEALLILGAVQISLKNFGLAADALTQAAALNDRNYDVFYNLGLAHLALGNFAAAQSDFDRALKLAPASASALAGLGHAATELGRSEQALSSYSQALALAPGNVEALGGLGRLYNLKTRFDDALAVLDQASRLDPTRAPVHKDRAWALYKTGRLEEALGAADQALGLNPNYVEAHLLAGMALIDRAQPADALAHLTRALELEPLNADALFWRGQAHGRLQHYRQAAADLGRLYAAKPDYERLAADFFLMSRLCCDWSSDAELKARLLKEATTGRAALPPFALLTMCDEPRLLRSAAERYVSSLGCDREKLRPTASPRRQPADRLRVGYVAGEFRLHPTAYLIADLLEQHDRSNFEIVGFATGPSDDLEIGGRVRRSFDRLVECQNRDDREAATAIAAADCDVLIDLSGYTGGGRPGIFARRPTSVQVNYLGFPGTTGANYMDYIIADRVVIGDDDFENYTEAVCRLPHCYQCTNPTLEFGLTPTRAEVGLPEDGFVFCSFNHQYKLGPELFDVWMRILAQQPGSVLWMLADKDARDNLRKEAERRGVEPRRILFADRVPNPQHLARQRLGDLFLDSFPCNAHTTATEALLAGLPLVTLRGGAFAGRVAASVLTAAGLSELVTATLGDYEALCLSLSGDPTRLATLKERLRTSRATTRLFDTPRFAREIEGAYRHMSERASRGLPPQSFDVAAGG